MDGRRRFVQRSAAEHPKDRHAGRNVAPERRLRPGKGLPDFASASVSSGSGCDRHLTRFVAGKPPLEVRFPQAAARRRVLSTQTRRSPKRRRHDSFPSEAAVRATGLPNGRTRATGRWYPPGEPRSETASLLSRRGSGLQCNDGHANKRDAGARDIPAGQCNAIDDAQP